MNQERGVIIIIAFLTLGILLILGSYFLIFTITESKISKSQEVGNRAYYLAEAGINEAIWKLKYDATTTDGDPAWASDFIDPNKNPYPDGSYWSASFSRSLFGGSYSLTIQNSSQARGKITATSTIPFVNGKTAQRVVKTTVFKAFAAPTQDSPVFGAGTSENVTIQDSNLQLWGNLLGNNNMGIKDSQVTVTTTAETGGKVLAQNIIWDYNLIDAKAICGKNICQSTSTCACGDPMFEKCEAGSCPINPIPMPAVDFDSADPNSYKSQASTTQDNGQCNNNTCNGSPCPFGNQCVFTESEFAQALSDLGDNDTLILNNRISYVTGRIDLRRNRNLVINGALVADRDINIASRGPSGITQLTINDPGAGYPSGLLSKDKISFGEYLQSTEIFGLIYAISNIAFDKISFLFRVRGGVLANNIDFRRMDDVQIIIDNDIIIEGLWGRTPPEGQEAPPFSPVVSIEHWEEAY